MTQTPPAYRKHPGGDRSGAFTSRAKLNSDFTKIINDGLYYYEQDLWENDVGVDSIYSLHLSSQNFV